MKAVLKIIAFAWLPCLGIASCTYDRCVEQLILVVVPRHYTGIVDSTYIDRMDHASPILILHNHEKVHLNYYSEQCVTTISKGDFVVKQKDSLSILVYRDKQLLARFYPECDGREIKELPK